MIVPEFIMENVVSNLDAVVFNGKTLTPSFGYGNRDELTRFLDTFKDEVYPLIWMLPSKEDHDVRRVDMNMELIIAVNFNKEDQNVLNNERLEKNFAGLLIPITENLFKAIGRNQNATYDNKDYTVMKYPNYHERNDDKPDSIHYWDALTLSLNMSFTNNCKS